MAKCLSEMSMPKNKKLKALILISAPFSEATGESLVDFKLPASIENCGKQAEKKLYNSQQR